jgi:adenosylhomocysteine nucleosidase
MLCVISAMQEEMESLIAEAKIIEEHKYGIVGEIEGKRICIAISGIGKVKAAMCLQYVLSKYEISEIVNIGIAGGLTAAVDEIVVGDRAVEHDVENFGGGKDEPIACDEKLSERLAKLLKKHIIGMIATGDQFINSKKQQKKITKRYEAVACDMETAAYLVVARENGVPFAVVRYISDGANNVDMEEAMGKIVIQAEVLKEMTKKYLKTLN